MKIRSRFTILSLSIAAALWGAPAQAHFASPIVRAADAVGLNVLVVHQQYAETYDGATLDREDGNLSGISAFDGRLFASGAYLRFALRYAGGSDVYTGQTQGGTPVVSTTQNTVFDGGARFGWAFASSPDSAVIPYVTLGGYEWNRGLGGVLPYHEDYSHLWYGLGVAGWIAPSPRLTICAHGSVGRTDAASLYMTGLSSVGIPDQSFALGAAQRITAGIRAEYALTRRVRLDGGIDYLRFSYGASGINVIPGVATVQEPGSTTRQITGYLGAAFVF